MAMLCLYFIEWVCFIESTVKQVNQQEIGAKMSKANRQSVGAEGKQNVKCIFVFYPNSYNKTKRNESTSTNQRAD